MDFLTTLRQRNAEFAIESYSAGMKILPSRRTLILGCVDPRVDPMDVFKLQPGEAAVIRNVGGRVNPGLLETMSILSIVSQAGGEAIGRGWNIVVLHHTKCGIVGCYQHSPGLLARQMGVAEADLQRLAITDPVQAVKVDVAALKANPDFPDDLMVTGMVYDVDTGRIDIVVPTGPVRIR